MRGFSKFAGTTRGWRYWRWGMLGVRDEVMCRILDVVFSEWQDPLAFM
jgi:hypothetical protein